jgi:hypothetical protein
MTGLTAWKGMNMTATLHVAERLEELCGLFIQRNEIELLLMGVRWTGKKAFTVIYGIPITFVREDDRIVTAWPTHKP